MATETQPIGSQRFGYRNKSYRATVAASGECIAEQRIAGEWVAIRVPVSISTKADTPLASLFIGAWDNIRKHAPAATNS
jgi:hypothetical protein